MRVFTLVPLLLSSIAFAQFPDVIWEREGVGAESGYGGILWPMGDQNDDGLGDWAVVAYGSGLPGQGEDAVIEFFHGGSEPSTEPYMTLRWPAETIVEYGNASVCGDLNGDGYWDWYREGYYNDCFDSIRVDIFFGGPLADSLSDGTFRLPFNYNLLPFSGGGGVTGFPFDFNGDGYHDLYIYYRQLNYGVVLYGGETLDFEPDWILHDDALRPFAALPQTFGDLNGDGYSDIISNNVNAPQISYVFFGGANPDTIPRYTWDGFTASISYMSADLNGDNYDDLVIGRGENLDVHFGGLTLSPVPDMQLNFTGCSATPQFLHSAGDFNRDGYEDLAVIDYTCVLGWGKLAVYLGGRWMGSDPAFAIEGRTGPLDLIGIWMAVGVGDIDSDGIEDLAIGATNDNTDGRRGRVVILSGDTTFITPVDPSLPTPKQFALSVYPNPVNGVVTFDLGNHTSNQAVDLTIFNALGQIVSRTSIPLGQSRIGYDTSPLASGAYFVHSESPADASQKLIVLK